MSDDSEERLESLFEAALDLSPTERAALLDRECADDAALRARLEELLAADADAEAGGVDQWFVAPPLGASHLAAGELVAGRYRIVAQVGEGGMGIVYAADQLQPSRRVALKIVRPGLIGRDAMRRFAREAEALARLQHPGIAQVLEVGVDDGDPPRAFLVMEFVDGPDLLDFARGLPLRRRLELFADLTDAVAHAHARGVVHRDLKPANVLVSSDGDRSRVKVLDFGVARFIETDDARQSLLTHTHQVIGTLAYMSPEQVIGGHIDARSDVYALGVTLFQLLTGRLPIDVMGRSLADAARRVCEAEPTRLADLDSGLRGDVATIAGKCLEKDPERRYADASALAADLRRHLDDVPILARPPSALYQLGKFARRHRAIVGGVVATFLALAAGLIVAIRFARSAETQRAAAESLTVDLRGLMHDVLFEVEESLADIPGSTLAREQLVKIGLRYAERLAEGASDDARLAHELGAAYRQLGDIQGASQGPNLGDQAGALRSYERAKEMLIASLALDPLQAGVHQEMISVLQSIASLHRDRNDQPPRLAALAELRAAAERMVELGIDADVAADSAARAAAEEGRVMLELGRFEEALARFEVFRAFAAERHAAGRGDLYRNNLGVILGFMARVEEQLGRDEAADARYRESLALAEAAFAEDPRGQGATSRLGEAHRDLGNFLSRTGPLEESLNHFRRSLELAERLVELDPNDVSAIRKLGIAHHGVGLVLIKQQDAAGALAAFKAFEEIARQTCERSPGYSTLQRDVMIALAGIGIAQSYLGDLESAEEALAKARALSVASRDRDRSLVEGWNDVADMWDKTAEARARIGIATDDVALLERSIAAREEQVAALEHLRGHDMLGSPQARTLQKVLDLLDSLRAIVAERRRAR